MFSLFCLPSLLLWFPSGCPVSLALSLSVQSSKAHRDRLWSGHKGNDPLNADRTHAYLIHTQFLTHTHTHTHSSVQRGATADVRIWDTGLHRERSVNGHTGRDTRREMADTAHKKIDRREDGEKWPWGGGGGRRER